MRDLSAPDSARGRFDGFGRELLASVVVFLVALPLCMGIAIASGVPPALGLVSGIIGGIIVGSLAGAPLQVSGPAAGLAVLVWQFIETHGLVMLGWVALGAGLIQVLSGAFRLGGWFRAVSPAVVQGMLAGIGILIFASQFHVMVDDAPRGSGLLNLASIPAAIIKGFVPEPGTAHHIAAALGMSTIAVIVLWNRFRPKSLKMIPAPLVAVVLATVAAAIWAAPVGYVRVPDNLINALNIPNLADLEKAFAPSMLLSMLAFALIASAETLLCAGAVDRLHDGPRTRYDKELIAQGVGNMLAGLVGALPITGVIVRSSANVEAGAKTRWSGIMHGIWILGFVVALPNVIQMVPTSSLAAVLVYTGYKLLNVRAMRELWSSGRSQFAIYIATALAIVSTDLLTGVAIGFGLALARIIYPLLRMEMRVLTSEGRTDVNFRGAATFVQIPKIASVLDAIPEDHEVHLHVGSLASADHAAMEVISEWAERRPGEVKVEWDELEAKRRAKLIIGATLRGRAPSIGG